MTPGRSSTGRAPSLHGADFPLEANADMARLPPLPAKTVRTPDHSPADAGLVEHLATAVLVLERGTVIEQMNSAAQTLLDTSVQTARGIPLSDLVAAGELLDAIVRVCDTRELRASGSDAGSVAEGWEALLRRWAEHRLALGEGRLIDDALPRFEEVLIRCALARTNGHRQEAARLLGWGRNTLTRKIKELALDL